MNHSNRELLLVIRYAEGRLQGPSKRKLDIRYREDAEFRCRCNWIRKAVEGAGSASKVDAPQTGQNGKVDRVHEQVAPELIAGYVEGKLSEKLAEKLEARCWKSTTLTREVVSAFRFQENVQEASVERAILSKEKLFAIALGDLRESRSHHVPTDQPEDLPASVENHPAIERAYENESAIKSLSPTLNRHGIENEPAEGSSVRTSRAVWASALVATAAIILVMVSLATIYFQANGFELTRPANDGETPIRDQRVRDKDEEPLNDDRSKRDQQIPDSEDSQLTKSEKADLDEGKTPGTKQDETTGPDEKLVENQNPDSDNHADVPNRPWQPDVKQNAKSKIVDHGKSPVPKPIPPDFIKIDWQKNRQRGVLAHKNKAGRWVGLQHSSYQSISNHFVTLQDSWFSGKVDGLGVMTVQSNTDLVFRPTEDRPKCYDVELANGKFAIDRVPANTTFRIRFHQYVIELTTQEQGSAIVVNWSRFGFLTQIFRGTATGFVIRGKRNRKPFQMARDETLVWQMAPRNAVFKPFKHNSMSEVLTMKSGPLTLARTHSQKLLNSADMLNTLEEMSTSKDNQDRAVALHGLFCMGDNRVFRASIKSKNRVDRMAAMEWLHDSPEFSPRMQKGWAELESLTDRRTLAVVKQFAIPSLGGNPNADPKDPVMAQVLVNGMRSNQIVVREVCHYSLTRKFKIESDFDVAAPARVRRKSLEDFKTKLAAAIPQNAKPYRPSSLDNGRMGAGSDSKKKQ